MCNRHIKQIFTTNLVVKLQEDLYVPGLFLNMQKIHLIVFLTSGQGRLDKGVYALTHLCLGH